MENIRTPVDKREIIQYLKLRERTLHFSKNDTKEEEEIRKIKIRQSEINKLLSKIGNDTVKKENKKMQKAFYLREKKIIPISSIDGKPMPIKAIKGLTNAIEDVKKGRYKVKSSQTKTKSSKKVRK